MARIKFYLVKLNNKLILQIFDQRNRRYPDFRYDIDGNNFNILTRSCPASELYMDESKTIRGNLYIRGDDHHTDFNECHINFNSNSDRDKGYNIILDAFSKWSDFLERIDSDPVCEEPVYEETDAVVEFRSEVRLDN